jgi:hypothetical protein
MAKVTIEYDVNYIVVNKQDDGFFGVYYMSDDDIETNVSPTIAKFLNKKDAIEFASKYVNENIELAYYDEEIETVNYCQLDNFLNSEGLYDKVYGLCDENHEYKLALSKVLDFIKGNKLEKELQIYLMAVMNDPKQKPVFRFELYNEVIDYILV